MLIFVERANSFKNDAPCYHDRPSVYIKRISMDIEQ